MTEHLLQRGYRRIAFASAFRRNNDRVRERRIGCNPDPLTGARLLHQILDTCPEVDAIFFAGERLAIGAFFEAQSKGIQVPGRVAIAGFDFYEMNSQVYPSGITTIATPRRLIGTRAATLLLERTRNPSVGPSTTDLGFELAERGST
jgi:LacI family gluconate utilization system Gnt-I transcriptional repressor